MFVIFVGHLPRPIHGFSWVSQLILLRLKLIKPIFVVDRASPRTGKSHVNLLLRSIYALWGVLVVFFACLRRRPNSFYLGLSAGFGMMLDILYILLAKFFSIPIFVHHHSFSYLNNPNVISRACLRLLKFERHISLGGRMSKKLNETYAVPIENIYELSNAAFLSSDFKKTQNVSTEFSVGFLSNITSEKGIFEFLSLAKQFLSIDNKVNFLIAGPLAANIEHAFLKQVADLPNVKWVGPQYDEEKDAFFSRLDVLTFPTRYANEAEPVTIHEALRAGVPVIANDRGCIAALIDSTCGHVVSDESLFVQQAIAWLLPLIGSSELMEQYKCAASSRFVAMHEEHNKRLDHVLFCIAEGQPWEVVRP